MTEAIEYRIASLKTFVGWSVALLILLAAMVMIALGWVLTGLAFYGMGLLMGLVAHGRQTDGYARALWETIPGRDFSDPPTKEWKQELEERGEL